MHVTIINDCRDENAKGRQCARVAALFDAPVSFVGVVNDLEAAGNLIDILDTLGDAKGVVLVNVAPRNGSSRKWGNGTPFGYFRHKNVLVLASIEGATLSLVKKLKLAEEIQVLDIPTAVAYMAKAGALSPELEEHIANTQFRSLEFLPRAAHFLATAGDLPATPAVILEFPDAPRAVWFVDNFGNAKTTLLRSDIEIENGAIKTAFGTLPSYAQLKDVKDGELACVFGSSGIGEHRFLELMLQGGSAAQKLEIVSGATL